MKAKLGFAILFSLMAALPGAAFAQTGAGGGPRFDLRKKAESKEGKRWTLQEWLEQKNRNYMMDLWLGMYAPSPYEFFVQGSYLSYDAKTSTEPAASPETKDSHRSISGAVGAYALVMGLQGEYENNAEESYNDLSGSVNVRVLGNAVQGTHLILQYGLRTRNQGSVKLSQQFAGADLDLYFMRNFGVHGLYRGYLPSSEETLGDLTGSRAEGGIFIDFGPLRVFGQWFSEKMDAKKSGTTTSTDRTGIQSGLKLFF